MNPSMPVETPRTDASSSKVPDLGYDKELVLYEDMAAVERELIAAQEEIKILREALSIYRVTAEPMTGQTTAAYFASRIVREKGKDWAVPVTHALIVAEAYLHIERKLAAAEAALEGMKRFVEAFKQAYPDIRQLQDGWATDTEAWTAWDESVRQKTIDLGSMVFKDALAAIDASREQGRKG